MMQQVLRSTLNNWQHVDFRQIEVALLLVYIVGEALPVCIDLFVTFMTFRKSVALRNQFFCNSATWILGITSLFTAAVCFSQCNLAMRVLYLKKVDLMNLVEIC